MKGWVIAIGLIAFVIIIALSGCTISKGVRSVGAGAYDESLDSAKQFICNDTSVGSVRRAFGYSDEAMLRWIDFCFGDNAQIRMPPPDLEAQP